MIRNLSNEEILKEISTRLERQRETNVNNAKLLYELSTVSEKLIRSELLKTNFLSNIRNEINNPITSVLELSKYLSQSEPDMSEVKKIASMIHFEVSGLNFQLKNILLSAEIEAGEASLTVSKVNINSLIQSVYELMQPQIDKKNLTLLMESKISDELLFHTDAEKIHLILSNLLSNAIQFNELDGKIKIGAEINDGILSLSVSDSGIGISNEDKEHIYDRFRQLELGSSKTYGGHGLGLSITKALLDLMGGEILFKSYLNEGTSFVVKVPALSVGNRTGFSSAGNDLIFKENDCEFF